MNGFIASRMQASPAGVRFGLLALISGSTPGAAVTSTAIVVDEAVPRDAGSTRHSIAHGRDATIAPSRSVWLSVAPVGYVGLHSATSNQVRFLIVTCCGVTAAALAAVSAGFGTSLTGGGVVAHAVSDSASASGACMFLIIPAMYT